MTGIMIGLAAAVAAAVALYLYVRVTADEKLDDIAQGDLGMIEGGDADNRH